MDNSNVCDICGYALRIGDFPFCPHPRQDNRHYGFEPHYDEHVSAEGQFFQSIHEKVKFLDKNHIVPANNRDKGTMKGRGTLFFDQGRR